MCSSNGTDAFSSKSQGQLSKIRGPLQGYEFIGGAELGYEALCSCDRSYGLSIAAGWGYQYTKYPIPKHYHVEKAVISSFTFVGGAYIPTFFGPLIGFDAILRSVSALDITLGYRIGIWRFHSVSTLDGGILTSKETITPNGEKYYYRSRVNNIVVNKLALNLRYCLSQHFQLLATVEGQTMNHPKGEVKVSVNREAPFYSGICQATSKYIIASVGFAYLF